MKTPKTDRIARDTRTITATRAHLASLATITLDGVRKTPADIEKTCQSSIDAAGATAAAEAAFHEAVASETAAAQASDAMDGALRRFLVSQFRTSPDVLADFGIVLRKPATPTVQTKSVAVAKRAATRVARHTLGPKAKATIKGTLTTAGTSPAAASAPAAPPTPATPPKPTG
jgi:hypothetical protein